MSVTIVQETAEAVNGALHRLGWEFLGESDGGASTWWVRGSKPKQVRVEVQRSALADLVLVNIEWPNVSLWPRVIRGRRVLDIKTLGKSDDEIREATEAAVRVCLEVFRDVIAGEGVAGAAAANLAPAE